VLIGGGTAGIATLTEDEPRIVTAVAQDQQVMPAPPAGDGKAGAKAGARAGHATTPSAEAALGEQSAVPERRTAAAADRTAPRTPRQEPVRQPAQTAATRVPVAKPAAPARPVITTRTETEKRAIPFRTRLVRDPALPRGHKRVQTEGAPGEQVLQYAVTLTDGRPTDRRLVGSTVTRQPQHRVVAFGTRRGGWECRPDRGCKPTGRMAAGCGTESESAAVPLGGELAVLDELALPQNLLC
jgi:hypothetical protein